MSGDDENVGPQAWDAEQARSLIGCDIIVGLTYCDTSGAVEQQVQAYGVIISVEEGVGITIKCTGKQWCGEIMTLPPDLTSIQSAPPGEYRFRATGETFVDPDFQTTWSITKPKN